MSETSRSLDPLLWLIPLVYPSCLPMERLRRLDRPWFRACRRRLRQARRPTRLTRARPPLSIERIPMAMVSMKGMQAGMNKVRSINRDLRRHLLSSTRIRPLLCPCTLREVGIIIRHQDRDTRRMRCQAILTCTTRSSSTASTLRMLMRITINRQGPCPAPLSWVRRRRVGILTQVDNINRISSSINRHNNIKRARTVRRDRMETLRECLSSVPTVRSCRTMLLRWLAAGERP